MAAIQINNTGDLCKLFKRSYNLNYFLALLLALMTVILLTSPEVEAMPSFSRQTGVACSACHTQSFGPNLTPFGRDFKLGGYTIGGGSGTAAKLPPLGAMVMGTFTNTQKDQTVQSQDQPDGTLRSGYNKNNNFTFDEASLVYAGRIYGKVGAYSQLTYNGYDERLVMEHTDIRFADQLDLGDTPREMIKCCVWGIVQAATFFWSSRMPSLNETP